MRVALGLAALVMAAASSAAAQTEPVWSQGRFSFETTRTGWSVAAIPPEEEKIVLILQPDADAADGELRQMCLLEEKTAMPPPRGEATQAIANEMTRLVVQLERIDEDASGRVLLEQDGVLSAYDRADLVDPQNSQPVNRQRRHFFVADGGTVRMYQFFCFAYASAGPQAPDGLRVMLERLRISGATP